MPALPRQSDTRVSIAASVLALLSVAAAALPTIATAQSPEGHGIAGFWNLSFGAAPPRRNPTPVEAELMAHFPEGTIVLGDTGAVEFPPGDYGGLPVHAALRESARDYDPEAQTTVSLTCRPPDLRHAGRGDGLRVWRPDCL